MKMLLKRFRSCEDGATSIEYALIAALIAIGLVTSLTALGTALNGFFTDVNVMFASF